MCEEVLEEEREPGFVAVTLRPATVCGYAPRLRLDLTVNILTNHAINNGRITVFGGDQLRPNLHVEDMTDLYLMLLEQPDEAINGKIWNAGYHNLKSPHYRRHGPRGSRAQSRHRRYPDRRSPLLSRVVGEDSGAISASSPGVR